MPNVAPHSQYVTPSPPHAISAPTTEKKPRKHVATAPAVKRLGGWGYGDDLCDRGDFAAAGYAGGVYGGSTDDAKLSGLLVTVNTIGDTSNAGGLHLLEVELGVVVALDDGEPMPGEQHVMMRCV